MGIQDAPIVAPPKLTPSQQPFQTKKQQDDAAFFANISDAATQADAHAQQVNEFMRMNRQTPTGLLTENQSVGGLLANVPWLAHTLGVSNPQNIPAMNALSTRMALTVKPGSKQPVYEFSKFLGANPTVAQRLPSNEVMAREANAGKTMADIYNTFAQHWAVSHNGDRTGMDDAWRAFRDDHWSPDGLTLYPHGGAQQQSSQASPQVTVMPQQNVPADATQQALPQDVASQASPQDSGQSPVAPQDSGALQTTPQAPAQTGDDQSLMIDLLGNPVNSS